MKKFLYIFAAVALVASGCSKDGVDSGPSEVVNLSELPHDMIVLGRQLENPYTVENITKAVESLYPTKAGRVEIDPTDYYVRFLPADEEQYERLSEAVGIRMLDHPMDYEIVCEGDYYQDPELDSESITWQYAVVSKDFEFPDDIRCERLQNCYLSENDPATKSSDIDWESVEREAFRLTGNASMLEGPATKGGGTKPSGRIAIVDDRYPDEPVGVKGVRVSCNVFIRFASAYTDENGNYEMSKTFSSSPRYRLVFKNKKGFAIGFNLIIIPASISTLGKASAEGCSVNITTSDNSTMYARCVVNNAAFDYWEACTSGTLKMKTPPSNLRFWLLHITSGSSSLMLQQGALIDNSLIGEYLGKFTWIVKLFLPDITIGIKEKNDYASIYADALHECAHASHFVSVGTEWWDSLIKFTISSFVSSGGVTYGVGTEEDCGYGGVAEMWAYFVENLLMRERYPDETRYYGSGYWFSPQILTALEERGLSMQKIFLALTQDVQDVDALRDKLIELYPEFKTIILQAFTRYV